jgi:hypothetical protein
VEEIRIRCTLPSPGLYATELIGTTSGRREGSAASTSSIVMIRTDRVHREVFRRLHKNEMLGNRPAHRPLGGEGAPSRPPLRRVVPPARRMRLIPHQVSHPIRLAYPP